MILLYILFEKLHRYVFDYCYQSQNTDWGKHTPYKEANKRNKLEKYNKKIVALYNYLYPYFYKFRYKLCLYFPNKYRRYSPSKLQNLMKYEINKYYNFLDKIVLNHKLKQIENERLKRLLGR